MAALLSIGDFSRVTFLSVKALRHYHEVGLLAPAEIDSDTGYRRYDASQVPTAQVIRRLRELGMSLEEVRLVLDASDIEARNATISSHLQRMEGELERTRETVRSLRLLLDETQPPLVAIDYRSIEPTETLAIQAEIAHNELFDWLGQALPELRATVDEIGASRIGPDGALFSNELLEDEFGRIVAVVPVAVAAGAHGRAVSLRLPAVEYAVALHAGSLDDIDRTYAALGTVVAERAIGVRGPIREDYLISGFDTPDESQHRTEICWPVFQTTSTG